MGYLASNVYINPIIKQATLNLPKRFQEILLSNADNGITIAKFIINLNTDINPAKTYKAGIIEVLAMLSKHTHFKSFQDMTHDDLISFLNSRRKTEEADSTHKWIGTYNSYRRILIRFFRWLYYPDIATNKRPKPACLENISELRRKEDSTYQPTDLWSPQEDALFLKYCNSRRIKCYHMLARDLSARPHEILKMKIRDIVFKSENGHQYAQANLNGKTGPRSIPIFNALPYLKDYLSSEHPFPGNINSPLICGESKSLGRPISPKALFRIYRTHKLEIFPKPLNSPIVTPEDKPRIKDLLKKPWNPYVVGRHTSLTAKAKILKEPILKMHAGWRQNSNMHLKYEHWFGNEHSRALLEEYGIIQKDEFTDDLLLLKPKICPNCSEPNQKDSKFCSKCRIVLSYDAYEEMKEQQIDKNVINALRAEIDGIKRAIMK
jgi:integrase/recombinase XerD